MKILALETIGTSGEVAALESGGAPVCRALPAGQRSAQSLAPGIERLLAELGWSPKQVDVVGVVIGPGSFTGVRVGLTTARLFAYAVQASLVGLTSFEVVAEQFHAARPVSGGPAAAGVVQSGPLWTVIDAYRGQLFAARFPTPADPRAPSEEPRMAPLDAWLSLLQRGEFVSGPYLRRLKAPLPEGVVAAPEATWELSASTVARLTERRIQTGVPDDLWRLAPLYLRPSAAEEKAGGG